jgi:hypothetical protein
VVLWAVALAVYFHETHVKYTCYAAQVRTRRGRMARNRMPGRLSTATEFWIWHRFRDFCGVHLGQAAIRMRLRSRSNFARPYICRLIILMRLTVPSTGPEL